MDYFGNNNHYNDIYNSSVSLESCGIANYYSNWKKPEPKEPEPEKYSDEELEVIEKESINFYTSSKHYFSFFNLDSINKENDIKPSGSLEDMTIEDDEYVDFRIGTDPFDCGRRLYYSATVNIAPNVINTLIGCNGAGKSTIITMIKEFVTSNRFPCLMYNNLKDGGNNAMETRFLNDDLTGFAFGIIGSEGENICANVFNFLNPMVAILDGRVKRDDRFRQYRDTDHIFLLLDAVDSGFSIDNIITLKDYLNKLITIAKDNNKNLYIIVAANSFEFVVDARSWDIQKSKEVFYTKDDYVKYRKRIVETKNKIKSQLKKIEEKPLE